MSTTPEQKLVELTKRTGHIDEAKITAVYDQLKPVTREFLLGEWKGGSFDTGHSTHKLLETNNWAGKNFRSVDDVDPIVLYEEEGKRVWCEQYGHAQLREVKYRGIVSAAMIYDNFPIIDTFRYVSHDVVVGAMDNKLTPDEGTYFFYLTKIK